MQLAVLMASAALTLGASDQGYVKRGEPQREGQAWVERTQCGAPVREGGRLTMRAAFGSVVVKVGRSDRMDCQIRIEAYTRSEAEARRYFKSFELSLRAVEGSAYLTAKSAHERHHSLRMNADFLISVPARFNLDLETEGGDVDVERLDGELRAVTAGGDIRTGDVIGPVRVETAGGGISLGNIGRRLDASTAGGGIRVGNVQSSASLETSGGEIVAGRIGGELRAQTAGGDIVLRGASGPVIAETAGGQIQIGDCGASVNAETLGGNIHLEGARGMVRVESAGGDLDLFRIESAVHANTAAGRILAEILANRASFSPSHLETTVGDVQVFLPADLPLNIEAVIDEAAGHKIFSDFPLTVHGAGESVFGTGRVRGRCALNGGGKELTIHTVMGNIEIRKLNSVVLNQLKQRQELYWKNFQVREQQQMQEMLRRLQRVQQVEMQRLQDEIRRQNEQLPRPVDQVRKPQLDDDDDH